MTDMTDWFKVGDLVGKVYQGNCINCMETMPAECVDMVLTSPPYDNLRSYKGYSFDLDGVIAGLYKVVKPGGVVVWVVGDATSDGSETGTSFKQALRFKDRGFNLHDTMIYGKLNYAPLTHNRYEQSFEYMFVFSKGKPKTFNPIRVPCKNAGKVEKCGLERRRNYGKMHRMRLYKETAFRPTKNTKIAPNVFYYTSGTGKLGHPAPFPEQLAKDQIMSWSNEGDIIYDPMCGSGTTLKMAKLLGRKWIGSEISEDYCDMARRRVNEISRR